MSQHPLYADWNYTLRHGFNLLVHGPGSKRTLLNTFASMYTHNMHAVCVDAYKPKLDLKAILTSICTDILMLERIPARKNMPQDSIDVEQTSAAFDKILHLVELIRAHTSHATEFCLVIHNIDGAELQNAQAQLALSMLADNRFVHIIASADNVNAQLLWNTTMQARFRWCYQYAPTYLPYTEESIYLKISDKALKKQFNLDAIKHVLGSQAKMQHRILKVLIQKQLKGLERRSSSSENPLQEGAELESSSTTFEGLAEQEFLDALAEETIVLSLASLKSQIQDLIDHDIILRSFSSSRGELYSVPYSSSILEVQVLPLLTTE